MTTLIDPDLWRERELPELVEALKRHVRLLREYRRQVYHAKNDDYSGELAAKLRLLVASTGNNKPLLLLLMREFDFNPVIKLDVPPLRGKDGNPIPDTTTLDAYMRSSASQFQTKSGLKTISIDEYISLWSNKYGSAHEDWTRSDDLIYLESGANLFATLAREGLGLDLDRSLHDHQMRVTTNIILQVADNLLSYINQMSSDKLDFTNVSYLYRRNKSHPHYRIRYAIILAKQERFGRAKAIMRDFEVAGDDPFSHWLLIQYRPLVRKYREACASAEILLANGWFMSRQEGAWLVHFNYACALSCLGEVNRAAEELLEMERWKQAIPAGSLENDPELEQVRAQPELWVGIIQVLRGGYGDHTAGSGVGELGAG